MIEAWSGFLGLPRDWEFLRDAGFEIEVAGLRGFGVAGRSAIDLDRAEAEHPETPKPRNPATAVFLGYSMGGRLGLQAILNGARYERAVFVSTRISRAEEIREAWAKRFESDEPWDALMRDWDAQPLFGGHRMPRDARDFDRRELARQLREWSPAVLPAAEPRLHELTLPTLWIAGERDPKYVAEARRAAELAPNAAVEIVKGAAHRVPWERPDAFIAILRSFLGTR